MSPEVSPGTFIPAWGGGIGIPTSGPRGGHLGGAIGPERGEYLILGENCLCATHVCAVAYIYHTHMVGRAFHSAMSHEAPGLGFALGLVL